MDLSDIISEEIQKIFEKRPRIKPSAEKVNIEEPERKYITSDELKKLENELDNIFKSENIDVVFTTHFLDRINDKRNEKEITIEELRSIFKEVFNTYTDLLKKNKDEFQAVIKSISTNINIPFVIEWDEENDEIDLINKTIMRKKDFKTSNPFLNVNETVLEEYLDEEYPSSFNFDEFEKLKSFAARKRYCEEHLSRISSGSARIVYKVDDEKVLKLAKNKKGLAQNEIEVEYSEYHDLEDIVAKVFESHPDYYYVEMELARKMKKSDFKRITGFSFEDYSNALHNHWVDSVSFRSSKVNVDKEVVKEMWEDEFVYDMFSYIANYSIPVGDLKRTSSYGIVKRNGRDTIVLIDYGLNDDVYTGYYS